MHMHAHCCCLYGANVGFCSFKARIETVRLKTNIKKQKKRKILRRLRVERKSLGGTKMCRFVLGGISYFPQVRSMITSHFSFLTHTLSSIYSFRSSIRTLGLRERINLEIVVLYMDLVVRKCIHVCICLEFNHVHLFKVYYNYHILPSIAVYCM